MYHEDYIMRQVQMMVHAIARVVLGKSVIECAEVFDAAGTSDTDRLAAEITKLVDERRIGTAEDLLFENIEQGNPARLALAVSFYDRLNALSDDALKEGGFSRAEVADGLRDAAARFGLDTTSLYGEGGA